jgi:hypothetical protein
MLEESDVGRVGCANERFVCGVERVGRCVEGSDVVSHY